MIELDLQAILIQTAVLLLIGTAAVVLVILTVRAIRRRQRP